MEPKPKMDLDSECSILEVVEDNEEIPNDSVPGNSGNIDESKVQNIGSIVVENNDYNELFLEVKQKGADVTECTNSPPVDLKPEMSPSPARKGHGLRKWRRIQRDTKKGGYSTIDTGKMVLTHQLSNSYGTCSTNNGILNERLKQYDGENGDEVQGCEQVTDGHRGFYGGDGGGGHEGLSPESGVADSSSEVKEERSENHMSSSDHQDPLNESLFALQSVREALEKEVLLFLEIGEHISVDDSVSDLGTELIDDEQNASSEQLPSEGARSFSQAVQSEVVETGYRDVETEVEDLFKQKIEAEVEYMAISRTVQKLRVAAVDQITVLEEQKSLVSAQTQILNKLGAAENKAAVLKKEAEQLENICEDIASVDEIMRLQKRVCKYSSCFFVQLVLLLVILGIFVFHLSPTCMDVVPT